MSTTTRSLAAGSTTRKVVGSIGILGTAAAVAGLGTFGNFTDSTAPVSTTVTTGTLDITAAGTAVSAPIVLDAMVPGDSVSRTIDLRNAGSLPFGTVGFSSTAAVSGPLTTDPVNGLQLRLQSCAVAWTADNTCAAPSTLYAGAAVTAQNMSNPASLAVNGTDHLLYTISLPTSADNSFQGKSANLSLTFTATQATGTVR